MPSSESSIFPDGELSVRPSERRIDMILRAGFAAGASEVLIRPGAPLALRIGVAFVRPGAHPLSADFVDLLVEEVATASERASLGPDEDLEVEIGLPPWAPCAASVFLGGGRPGLLIHLPGIPVEREEPPPPPRPEDLRRPPLLLTVDACRREIDDCVRQCEDLHDRRLVQAFAARRPPDDPARATRSQVVGPLKWRDSRRRSRRLMDRLAVVTSRAEQDSSLEMLRAILREAVGILR